MKKDNIILIGMPGSGKSTLGVLLAKAMNYRFLDTDLLIQEMEGRLLCEILSERGTEAFLQIEEDVNASVWTEHTVIAPGGSAIYSERAMKHFLEIGTVVYLRVSLEELSRRLGDLGQRGVVLKKGQTLVELYEERRGLYERYAQLTIDVTKESIAAIFAELTEKLGSRKNLPG